MKKHKKQIRLILICVLVVVLGGYIDYKSGTNIFSLTTLTITVIGAVICAISAFKMLWWQAKDKIKGHAVFIIIIGASLVVPVVIHLVKFRTTPLSEEAFLSFYGDFISFLGTFALGYIIYRRDNQICVEAKLREAKLLYSCIDSVCHQLDNLQSGVLKVDRIEYDSQWKNYFYEISSLGFSHELELRQELEYFFQTVDIINSFLAHEQVDQARLQYAYFIKREQYAISKFNYIEAQGKIYEIAYLYGLKFKEATWDEDAAIVEKIDKFSDVLFHPIENYVWNYMIRNGCNVLDSNTILIDTVEWLLQLQELKDLVRSPYDKRIISKIFFNACLKMERDPSSRIGYCWREFTFK